MAAGNQLNKKYRIQFFGSDKPTKKILIMENSITYHGKKTEIGWNGNWGMAASKAENDYVHILYENSKKICTEVQFCVVQISSLEIDFCNESLFKEFEIIKNYVPDIAILRFGENIKADRYDPVELEKSYESFIRNYLLCNNSNLIFTTCFWKNKFVDDLIRKYCSICGGNLVELGDLGDDDFMKALGLFEHSGVANHPGDIGMKMIAERIYQIVKRLL